MLAPMTFGPGQDGKQIAARGPGLLVAKTVLPANGLVP